MSAAAAGAAAFFDAVRPRRAGLGGGGGGSSPSSGWASAAAAFFGRAWQARSPRAGRLKTNAILELLLHACASPPPRVVDAKPPRVRIIVAQCLGRGEGRQRRLLCFGEMCDRCPSTRDAGAYECASMRKTLCVCMKIAWL